MALFTGSFLFLVLACGVPKKPKLSLYHWESKISLSEENRNTIGILGCRKLYVRFFDVAYLPQKNQVLPNAVLSLKEFKSTNQDSLGVVPVVYIENEAIKKYSSTAESLAKLIWQKVERMARNESIGISELQIDCDWTLSTKSFFHALCKSLKKVMPKKMVLSSTLRLHQLKYPDITGVPDVDYAVLMYYNMGKLADSTEKNSILNNEVGAEYLGGLESYPVKLKLALPAFAWGVVYNQEGVKGLINNLDTEKLLPANKVQDKDGNYLINKAQYLGGVFMQDRDRIRLEDVDLDELEKASDVLFSKYAFEEVILYHLNGYNLNKNQAIDFKNIIYSMH